MPRKSRATKTAGAALLNIARGTEAACAAVGNADDVPATLVELINTAPSKLAQGLAFELLSVLAAVEANLKPLRPTLSPLLDALEMAGCKLLNSGNRRSLTGFRRRSQE